MFKKTGKLLLLSAGVSVLSACGDGPASAPRAEQVIRGAEKEDANFAVFPVNRETLPQLSRWPGKPNPNPTAWIERVRGSSAQQIQSGDMLDLSIWDNGDSSLLAQAGQKVVELKGIRVSPEGEVFLPYVDRVYIGNMSPDRARSAIQDKFSAIIPSAQVQLRHEAGRQSSVDLISGVSKPGTVVMPDRDFTVLSLIAQGGGIGKDMTNPQIRLMRGSKLYGISAKRLMKSPSLDTTLRGGDKVYIENDERYFLSLGAANKQAQIPFTDDKLNALDAASLAGGLKESRANPKGVLILRDYAPKQVRADGSGPSKERIVFAIDLTSADGLFSAGEFQIEDRDVIVVTESPLTNNSVTVRMAYDLLGLGVRVRDIGN